MSEHKEGDTVTIAVTGKVAQKTTSGYIITIHGVDVPFVQISEHTQELAQKILEMIETGDKELQQAKKLGLTSGDLTRIVSLKDDIKQLCQEEVSKR
jgi:hypothetical protein